MSTATAVSPPTTVRLDTAGVARKLGRSTQTIRVFVKEQGLPALRVNGRLVFDEAKVDAWLEARAESASAPPVELDDRVRELVDQFPPLTAAQVDRVATLLRSSKGGAA
ncbi:helix-turn-helix domain-containing protein [Mycolicibacillus trivialis]